MFATRSTWRILKHSIHCVGEFEPLATNVDWLALKFLIQPVLNGPLYYLVVQPRNIQFLGELLALLALLRLDSRIEF